ncbi:rod shape-determining protein RodA [Effusibacillus dendaii]|uniref:rod shape-determining protein RodA n=1 Tax=Effusibacillus dendaii TaxID=2743772 RepID=UPI00190D06CF|nr:rod shape-determining protein RodA [Effusibacillus dendaii]
MIERVANKRIVDIDWLMVAIVAGLSVGSVVMVASASHVNLTGDPSYFYARQSVWFLIGFGVLFYSLRIDYAEYTQHWKQLYFVGIGLLVLVSLTGAVTNGAKSWFQIGPLRLEPAELMKIILILTMASLLENTESALSNKQLLQALSVAGLPVFLVILQPDLGTALMMSAIAFGILWARGIGRKQAAALLAVGSLAAGTFAALFVVKKELFFKLVHPYQWERLTLFLHPQIRETGMGAGYQLHQSMLAIGAGQIWGEGIFKGIQTQGAWIPERHTDFIFSVVAEELGFAGACLLLAAYFALLWRMIKIGREARDSMGALIVAGVLSMFLAQVFENVGMTMSIMPITGITLPLMSYGGSSILSSMLAIGLVLNVGYHRKKIKF